MHVDVHITTSNNFNQRVDLGNSYCNCSHLMRRRFEKVPGTLLRTEQKRARTYIIHHVVQYLDVLKYEAS